MDEPLPSENMPSENTAEPELPFDDDGDDVDFGDLEKELED